MLKFSAQQPVHLLFAAIFIRAVSLRGLLARFKVSVHGATMSIVHPHTAEGLNQPFFWDRKHASESISSAEVAQCVTMMVFHCESDSVHF